MIDPTWPDQLMLRDLSSISRPSSPVDQGYEDKELRTKKTTFQSKGESAQFCGSQTLNCSCRSELYMNLPRLG